VNVIVVQDTHFEFNLWCITILIFGSVYCLNVHLSCHHKNVVIAVAVIVIFVITIIIIINGSFFSFFFSFFFLNK